jgi:hypothetical protein
MTGSGGNLQPPFDAANEGRIRVSLPRLTVPRRSRREVRRRRPRRAATHAVSTPGINDWPRTIWLGGAVPCASRAALAPRFRMAAWPHGRMAGDAGVLVIGEEPG